MQHWCRTDESRGKRADGMRAIPPHAPHIHWCKLIGQVLDVTLGVVPAGEVARTGHGQPARLSGNQELRAAQHRLRYIAGGISDSVAVGVPGPCF